MLYTALLLRTNAIYNLKTTFDIQISHIVIPSILLKHLNRGILVIYVETAILLGQSRQLQIFSFLYYYIIDILFTAHTQS